MALNVPVAAQDADALFKSKCAACHTQQKALEGLRKKPEAQWPAHLEKFLQGHFAPDAVERTALTAHLIKAAGK